MFWCLNEVSTLNNVEVVECQKSGWNNNKECRIILVVNGFQHSHQWHRGEWTKEGGGKKDSWDEGRRKLKK